MTTKIRSAFMIVDKRWLPEVQYMTNSRGVRRYLRDDESGSALAQSLEAFLDQLLGLGIDCTGRFIEQNYLRLFEDGSGNSHPLLFASREFARREISRDSPGWKERAYTPRSPTLEL
jgi:hypothetical protein